MTLLEAIENRHSVRSYTDRPIEPDVALELQRAIDEANSQSGLHIQLQLNESDAFSGILAKYGSFYNVKNYMAIVGPKGSENEEKCGYFGQRIVLKAQQLGLNSCWVALTYRRSRVRCNIQLNERLYCVVALGYGVTNGHPRRTKPVEDLSRSITGEPDWFLNGVRAAQLAPTAMNQQQFRFDYKGDTVVAKALVGVRTRLDLGIAKCHFEIGAGTKGWRWG